MRRARQHKRMLPCPAAQPPVRTKQQLLARKARGRLAPTQQRSQRESFAGWCGKAVLVHKFHTKRGNARVESIFQRTMSCSVACCERMRGWLSIPLQPCAGLLPPPCCSSGPCCWALATPVCPS